MYQKLFPCIIGMKMCSPHEYLSRQFTFFFSRSLQNPAPVLHAQHISVWTGHTSSAEYPPVASGYHVSIGLDTSPLFFPAMTAV